MILALFDFDHTITTQDSFLDFIRWAKGKGALRKFYVLKSPILIGYKLGLVSGKKTKETALRYFFKDISETRFKQLGKEYVENRLEHIFRPAAIDKLNWHKAENHKIAVVTASLSYWIAAWCEANGLDLICTEIEIVNEKVTGKLSGENNNYDEKVRRVKQQYRLEDYSDIYAYGDSKGDSAMLAIAHHKFYRKFV